MILKNLETYAKISHTVDRLKAKVLHFIQLMKATVLAESSNFIYFHQALSAPAMFTDIFSLIIYIKNLKKVSINFINLLTFQLPPERIYYHF